MANYSQLKAAIADVIKTNGTQAITGQVLQDVLNSMVSVIGANYTFAGVATPSTNPSTPDQNVFYIALQKGTYTNFGGADLPTGISLLVWNGTWSSETLIEIDAEKALRAIKGNYDFLNSEMNKRVEETDGNFQGDLAVCDDNGEVLVIFKEGGIKTKKFDSKEVAFKIKDYQDIDLAICDENGEALVIFDGGIAVKNFSSSLLKGKRISFMGDSITTFDSYPGSNVPFYTGENAGITSVDLTWWGALCKRQNAIINRIYAYGGGDVVNNICLHYDELFSNGTTGDAPDLILILAGVNDWYHGKTLGTIDDAVNSNTTFYAAYNYLLSNLKVTYPNAKIVGLTILNSMVLGTTVPYTNSQNNTLKDFCHAIVQCCDYYSVPVIDTNSLVNINGNNYTELLVDYTHPNVIGVEKLTNAINNNICRIF